MSHRALLKQQSQNIQLKRGSWRKNVVSTDAADNAAGGPLRAPDEGGIPWQIFHEPQDEEQAQLIWDPVGSLSAETAELQPNRGFSGFSETSVYRNGVYSGPYHLQCLKQA